MPNTRTASVTLHVETRPTVTWLAPAANACAARSQQLLAETGSPAPVTGVRFLLDGKPLASGREGSHGTWKASWNSRKAARGKHVLSAVVRDEKGRTATATLTVRRCG